MSRTMPAREPTADSIESVVGRMGIRRRALWPAFFAAVVALRAGAACSDPAEDPPPLRMEGGPGIDPVGSDSDAQDGAKVDAGPPTYCAGIVTYVSFDEGGRAEVGGGVARIEGPDAAVPLASGRFGNAAALRGAVDGGGIASIFFDRRDAGDGGDGGADEAGSAMIYPEAEGTLAFWYRQTDLSTNFRSFIRPYGLGSSRAGLTVASENGQFGLWGDLGGQALLTFAEADIAPFLRGSDFDHYAYAWKRANPDAGQPPFASLILNGGLGEVFADGGFDAAAYADAAPDDAGNLFVPYRARTTRTWPVSLGQLVTLRVGGVVGTAPQGSFDELAIWNRVLSLEELAELYKSTLSLRDACHL